ncbi:MAG: winged helix-turn-helix transcriptional regulator [Desulfurococcales archaeon]|nr:winged helix-turn-helix transcriptional regulator [Desulfurococcales archaeon]
MHDASIPLRESDVKILSIIVEYGPISLTELSSLTGYTKSWVWKKVKRLESLGLVSLDKRSGTLYINQNQATYKGTLRIGILRASEYPYIIPFSRLLKDITHSVTVAVYDEAYKLASDLASGRVHLAFAPAVTLIAMHRLSGGRVHIIGGGSRGGTGIVYSRQGGYGHATTMASTMELCATVSRLKPPRVYKRSGNEILESVFTGEVEAGVVWEPYLYIARNKGLDVEACRLPFCCLLGANSLLEDDYRRISSIFARSLDIVSARGVDLQAYAELIGMDYGLVEATVSSYEYIREIPVNDLKMLSRHIVDTIMPPNMILDSVYI